FSEHERKPPRRIASTRGRSLQVELPGSQGHARGERPYFDLRKRERSHGLVVRVAPSIAAKNRVSPAPNHLIADEGGFRRVLVIRRERHKIAAIPHRFGVLEHRANFFALRREQRRAGNRPAEKDQPTEHADHYMQATG